jgi:hypothetical protein
MAEPRDIKLPAEIVQAAELAFNSGISPKRAADMLKYHMFRLALKRANGSAKAASISLKLHPTAIGNQLPMLEVRLG